MGALGWSLVGTAWLLVGVAVAAALVRQGHPAATAAAAVPCWPLLVPLLGSAPTRTGPTAARIHTTVDRLGRAWQDGVDHLPVDLAPLRQSLLRADGRLARFDHLLADATDAQPADLDRLRAARADTAAEIEAVLAELVRLRVQIGLASLTADRGPLQDRLRELAARVGAHDELDRLTT